MFVIRAWTHLRDATFGSLAGFAAWRACISVICSCQALIPVEQVSFCCRVILQYRQGHTRDVVLAERRGSARGT